MSPWASPFLLSWLPAQTSFSECMNNQPHLLLLVLHDPQRLIYKMRQVVAPVPGSPSGRVVTAELAELRPWRVL